MVISCSGLLPAQVQAMIGGMAQEAIQRGQHLCIHAVDGPGVPDGAGTLILHEVKVTVIYGEHSDGKPS